MNLKEIIYIRIIAQLLYHWCYFKSLLFINKKKKLHVGCGKNKFSGWINADVVPSSELIVFLQKKLPFRKEALSRIYTEHVLEHASYEVGLYFMKEAYRVLEIGGVVRLAMPDLDDLIEAYVNDWRRLDWVNWPESAFIKTKGQMINISFRWWGHRYLYNREDVVRLLEESGFKEYYFSDWGESRFDDLSNLETRKDSKLIIDAIKN